jgi:hypothetical protein
MELTTGAILRLITETPLSTSAHKLAHLAEKMGVSQQHLTALLVELAGSGLALVRWKPNGKFAPWLFRIGGNASADAPPDVVSSTGDTSLSRDSENKTIFAGRIEIAAGTNVYRTPWASLIKTAKASLACWNVDTQVIWERFLAFNSARGNTAVPAGYLLGFMRRWRTSLSLESTAPATEPAPSRPVDRKALELHDQIRAAPSSNRQFHASDLCRLIGQAAYDARVLDVVRVFGCPRFAAILAVHGQAVLAGEISK